MIKKDENTSLISLKFYTSEQLLSDVMKTYTTEQAACIQVIIKEAISLKSVVRSVKTLDRDGFVEFNEQEQPAEEVLDINLVLDRLPSYEIKADDFVLHLLMPGFRRIKNKEGSFPIVEGNEKKDVTALEIRLKRTHCDDQLKKLHQSLGLTAGYGNGRLNVWGGGGTTPSLARTRG